MSKKFIYTEFNLEKSKLIQLSDNGFQIILKFIEKTDLKKTLIVRSIFIDLGENIFDIEVRSSIYDNINSKNGIFNFKLGILEEEKANPFLLMKKVFSKVQTTNLYKTSSNYNQLLLDTFSLKLWKRNNSTKLGLKKDDTSSSASTTTSSQACTSCKSTTELPSNLSGTYGTEDECDCFSISGRLGTANNSGTTATTIYGNINLSGQGSAYYNYGTTTIHGNIILSGKGSAYYNSSGTTTIYGNIIKRGQDSGYYNNSGTLIINGMKVPPPPPFTPPSNGGESLSPLPSSPPSLTIEQQQQQQQQQQEEEEEEIEKEEEEIEKEDEELEKEDEEEKEEIEKEEDSESGGESLSPINTYPPPTIAI